MKLKFTHMVTQDYGSKYPRAWISTSGRLVLEFADGNVYGLDDGTKVGNSVHSSVYWKEYKGAVEIELN